jgi:hypothetical protein
MSDQQKFSKAIAARLGYYVYRLIDPRNGETFYVGKGTWNRIFQHVAGVEQDDAVSEKLERIRKINAVAGLTVGHVIHRHGMDAETAYEVEAALMDAYPGLSNIAGGHGSGERGTAHVAEIIERYEAEVAQIRHQVILINVSRSSEEGDLYEAVRYAWRLDVKRARRCEFVLATANGLIRGVYGNVIWKKATAKNFPGREGVPKRWGFYAEPAEHKVWKYYVGKRVPDGIYQRGAANPIRYIVGEDTGS